MHPGDPRSLTSIRDHCPLTIEEPSRPSETCKPWEAPSSDSQPKLRHAPCDSRRTTATIRSEHFPGRRTDRMIRTTEFEPRAVKPARVQASDSALLRKRRTTKVAVTCA